MHRRSIAVPPHLQPRATRPDAADSHRAPRRRRGGGAVPLDTFSSPPWPWASFPWARDARSKVAGGMGEVGKKEWTGR